MGAKNLKRKRFFAAHPICCFCGGSTPAETQDHIPARGLFLGRLWPEGYVFPACVVCNNESSRDELLLAWLVRIRLGEYDIEAEKDFERASIDLARGAPDVWAAIRVHGRAESRRFLKESLLPQAIPGVTDVVYSFDVPKPMMEAANRYARKLGKALHYFHTGRIVPVDAVVKARVFSNAAAMGPAFPEQVFTVLTQQALIQRAKTSLKEQFDYRFAVVEAGEATAFVVTFGQSTVIVAAVFEDQKRYEHERLERVFLASIEVASPDLPSSP